MLESMAAFKPSTTDGAHCAIRLLEIRFANVMAFFLLQDNRFEPFNNFPVTCPTTKKLLQVMLAQAEKTCANFPIGRQPDPIALATKRLTDGGNNPDFAGSA